MIVGYVRVSSIEQNEARQLVTMEKYNVEKLFKEKISAKDVNRPALKNLLEYVREGDVVVVHDFSRLARSTKDLLNIVEQLQDKDVNLISSKENIDSSKPVGKLMMTMIGAINEFERTNLLERQMEGIIIAKQKGKYKGSKKIVIENFEEYYNKYMRRELNKGQMAEELNISRPTLNRIIKEYKVGAKAEL
ncbi:recombinase family protein [Clostridioides sp. ZZV15-6383]|uniref:recombinase family protein n=1 Tax=Clostridioides sp. ZZV15-6383 TaxID=2811498 RepID=UPI001D11C51E|nr:recombinase family protein [Clostridioides sp. ZZV15-6383]